MAKRKVIGWLGLGMTYIGAVIGAGFASGQEIVTFFTRYGVLGLAGVGLASGLFVLTTYLILSICRQQRMTTFAQLAAAVCGPALGRVLNGVMVVILLGSLGVMLAGSGAIIQDMLGINYDLAVTVTAILVAVTVLYDIEGLTLVNSLLVPGLIVITLVISGQIVAKDGIAMETLIPLPPVVWPWWLSAIIYVSYNIGLGGVVLTAAAQDVDSPGKAALLGGGGLGVLAGALWSATYTRLAESLSVDIPVLRLAQSLSPLWTAAYAIGFWLAVMTTAVASAYGVLQLVTSWSRRRGYLPLLTIFMVAIVITRFGFASLVRWLYPAYGFASLFFLILLLSYPCRHR